MKKNLAVRRVINRRIADRDAASRCTACRRTLPQIGVLILLTPAGQTIRYCNEVCRQDHIDALLTMEARR